MPPNKSQCILEILAIRVRIATADQVAQMVGLSHCRTLAILRHLRSEGFVREHHVWSVSPLPETDGPLFTWYPEEELDINEVRIAATIGIKRWRNLRPCVIRTWCATEKGCRRFGVRNARMSRASEIAHDLLFSEIVSRMSPEIRKTVVKEDAFGRQFPIARALHADAVVAGNVAETIGIGYRSEDMVAFANQCKEKRCGFALY